MNRNLLTPWIGCLALLGIAGCDRAATPETFPEAAADGWIAAFNSGDALGLALMYGPDAKILPPDEPIISGGAAIEQYWETFKPGNVRIEVSEVESMKLGDFWFREGMYAARDPNEGAPRVGKFIELWSRVDSAWLLHRHMWSPNTPMPAAMPELAPDT